MTPDLTPLASEMSSLVLKLLAASPQSSRQLEERTGARGTRERFDALMTAINALRDAGTIAYNYDESRFFLVAPELVEDAPNPEAT